MKIGFLSCLLLLSFNVLAQIENDKILHFAGGTLYGLAGAGIAKEISDGNRFWTFAGAIGGSALVGLGKEAIDSNPNGSGWDNGDLLATVLGGATIGVTIDIFTNHKKQRKTRTHGGLAFDFSEVHTTHTNINYSDLPSLAQLAMPKLFTTQQIIGL